MLERNSNSNSPIRDCGLAESCAAGPPLRSAVELERRGSHRDATAAANADARAASAGMLLGDREAEARGRGGGADRRVHARRALAVSTGERARAGGGELTEARASPLARGRRVKY